MLSIPGVGKYLVAALVTISGSKLLGAEKESAEEWVGPIKRAEDSLRELLRSPSGPVEVYALLSEGTWGGAGQRYVLLFSDHALLRCDDGNGRTRERDVTTTEAETLGKWLSSNKVDSLPKFDELSADGIQYEYFHRLRDGSEHRVYMNNPPGAPIGAAAVFPDSKRAPKRKLYGELTQQLLALDKAPMHTIYEALRDLPGFRVFHSKEQGEIVGLSKIDDQLMVARWSDQTHNRVWYAVTDAGVSTEPLPKQPFQPHRDSDFVEEIPIKQGSLAGRDLLVSWSGKREGLWISGDKPELLARGIFGRNAVLCPGGDWLVAAKTPDGKMWNVPNGVVRVHLATRRVHPVDLPPADNFDPLAWIAARQRVLLYRQRDDPRYLPPRDEPNPDAGPEKPEYYLLDPSNGETKQVAGEFRPLKRLEGHTLQATAKPNEFWAVIVENEEQPKPTAVLGGYDTQEFRFTQTLRFPEIWFHSWDVYVDEPAGAIWIAVNGDLLRLSLPLPHR